MKFTAKKIGHTKYILMVLCVTFFAVVAMSQKNDWTWHTSPEKWEKSRNYNYPFDDRFANQIVLGKADKSEVPDKKTYSPNDAYWAGDRCINPDGIFPPCGEPLYSPSNMSILIYTERDYLLELKLLEIFPNFGIKYHWINEKLLYVDVWWGRIKGSYAIIDVENECFVIKEMMNNGYIEFNQYQEGTQWNKKAK